MSVIETEIASARKKLLDLTMRNRLLNFVPSKTSTLRIMDEIPREIFDILVLQERKMEFKPLSPRQETPQGSVNPGDLDATLTAEERHKLWSIPELPADADGRHTDRFLQTSLEPEPLQKRLFQVYQKASTIAEEQGYTVLFLALGFLRWKESQSVLEHRLAPLILVPVEIERTNVRSGFSIRWTGEEIQTNQSLQAKLLEQQVALQEFVTPESKEELDIYFNRVREACSSKPDWTVEQSIYLNFFNFAKFVMYKDLDPSVWADVSDLVNHPLLKKILDPDTEEPGTSDLSDENRIDEEIDFRNIYHVLDADPSQIAVIEDIKKGHNLVVEGPPGTGKSQTITNAIAELLAQGKTVLFVSEKMAALEVVKSRLDAVGLGDFCLELHSRKAKKKEVLQELQRTVGKRDPTTSLPDEIFHRFDHVRNEVNQYPSDLRTRAGSRGLTVFGVLCEIESARAAFKRRNRSPVSVSLPGVSAVDSPTWETTKSAFKSIADVLPMVSPIQSNVWCGTSPYLILPADESQIDEMLGRVKFLLEELVDSIATLYRSVGISAPETISRLDSTLPDVQFLVQGHSNSGRVFQDPTWDGDLSDSDAILNLLSSAQAQLAICRTCFTTDALSLDAETLVTSFGKICGDFSSFSNKFRTNQNFIRACIDLQKEYEQLKSTLKDEFNQDALNPIIYPVLRSFLESGESFFRFLSQKYRRAKKEILSTYKAYKKRSHKELSQDIQRLERFFTVADELNEKETDIRSFFGHLWKGPDSSITELESFSEWALSLGHSLQSDCLAAHLRTGPGRSIAETTSPLFKSALAEYERTIGAILAVLDQRIPYGYEAILGLLDQLKETRYLLQSIEEVNERGKSLFGDLWEGVQSNAEALHRFRQWMPGFRERFRKGVYTQETITCLSSIEQMSGVSPAIEDVAWKREACISSLEDLLQKLNADPHVLLSGTVLMVSFKELKDRIIELRNHVHELQPWSQYCSLLRTASGTFARSLLGRINSGDCEPEDIIPALCLSYAETLLHEVFQNSQSLSTFISQVHEKKISEFKNLDKLLIERNRSRLLHNLQERRPTLSSGSSPGSAAGVLMGEFNKKRRHLPIRKLLRLAGPVILDLRPCFMMSPISIAQFLEPQSAKFDVILFDEASQVKPEDALGALLRGKQLVVMGDTKQLPPTSFFDRTIEDVDDVQEEEATASIVDIESILHQCRRTFPMRKLKWHYRSRHDSLIVVSNHEFYDNQLLIYPSAIAESPQLGSKFRHLPETVYDRGKSSANREEARIVAQEVMEHFRSYPHKSLGVGAFSTKQQSAILEELELRRKESPQLEEFFSPSQKDHFFVKNLETIQGDERDVIFLSIGYGFDRDRQLRLNFGPLNQEGGERRLNVLTTRAREKCVVFSNFRAADLAVDHTKPFGLRALRTYLEYAESRTLASIDDRCRDSDSPFEDSIYDVLVRKGYEVKKQVGSGGFRVDLAVVHPDRRGTFALGIECDGAQYHSSRVARERDRLRQEILEGLGWRIHRVWSTDWYRNRVEVEQVLSATIESAIAAPAVEPIVSRFPCVSVDQGFNSNAAQGVASNKNSPSLEDWGIGNYVACSDLRIAAVGELHEAPLDALSEAIVQIVDVESPVHESVVIGRIRDHWNLGRAGNRIQERIKQGIALAKAHGRIHVRGKFLWRVNHGSVEVRRRDGELGLNIEYIPSEEIHRAIILVLEQQSATIEDDLVSQTARLFGFQRVKSVTRDRIVQEVRALHELGTLQTLANGMIDSTKQQTG